MRLSSLLLAGVSIASALFGSVRAEDEKKRPPIPYKFDSAIIHPGPSDHHSTSKRALRWEHPDSDFKNRLSRRTNQNGNEPSFEYYFDQKISHSENKGTFKQRYWFSDEYWGGIGYPIFLMTPGEQAADLFFQELTGSSLINKLMQKFKGAGVILEHRYYGESSPYTSLTTANLKHLNLDNSIEDIKFFVDNAKLPWASSAKVKSTDPAEVPWVHVGCSYPGLLAAYIQSRYPDLFAASWASSAPVQADDDFWEYYNPIEEGMPKNCSSDAGKVITHIDSILKHGDPGKILDMKRKFGMQDTRDDDFAQSIAMVFWPWQSLQAYSYAFQGYSPFYQFCDALETKSNGKINESRNGVGLPRAYDNYAAYFKKWYSDWYCPGGGCFSTYDYNSQRYKDYSVRNWYNRQWFWFVCTEFGWFQTGDPGNLSKIVSKFVTLNYNLRQCSHQFPNADGSLKDYSPDIWGVNKQYRGWNLKAPQLFVTNGEYDPWRSASLSSKYGPKYKKDKNYQKVVVIKGGHHCWDFSTWNYDLDRNVKRVVNTGIKQLRAWLDIWYLEHPLVDEPSDILNFNTGSGGGGGSSGDDQEATHTTEDDNTTVVNGTVNTPGGGHVKGVATPNGNDEDDLLNIQNPNSSNQSNNSNIFSSRPLVITSFALNIALLVALLAMVALYLFNRRKQNNKAARGGKYFAVKEDKLGEYKPSLMGGEKMRPLSLGSSKELYHDDHSDSESTFDKHHHKRGSV
ncbi:hypothetical protein FRC03_010084 [Tulasnella sp. 419]|nr:hypothetical protein FRC03_010084 [Tulasnella sp. 419]